jgi:4-hydroxy-3-methylbut-2-enyl diphosphate reductase IspH
MEVAERRQNDNTFGCPKQSFESIEKSSRVVVDATCARSGSERTRVGVPRQVLVI